MNFRYVVYVCTQNVLIPPSPCVEMWIIQKYFRKQNNHYAQLFWIVQAIDFGDCLPIGIVLTVNFRDFLLIGIVRKIDLGYCLPIGISRTIDLEGGLLIATIRTTDFGDCLLNGIVGTIDLGDDLLIWNCPGNWSRRYSISWDCPDNWCQRLFMIYNCLDNCFRLLTGIVWTVWPGGCLLR